MFRSLVLIASIIAAAYAFSDGAPAGVCSDLTPKHPADPQKGASPYKITINKEATRSGEEVEVTMEGTAGDAFKGFLLQARDASGNTVGTFEVDPNDTKVQTLDCPKGKKNAVTHRNSDPKQKITVKWLAPKDLHDVVTFTGTFVKDGLTFWVAQTSDRSLTVRP